jgi:hypothetical protein
MRFLIAALSLTLAPLSGLAETKLVLNKTGVAASLDTQKITVPEGERVVLSIPVLSGNVWLKDGQPIYGAQGRVYIIESAQVSHSGRYRVGYVGDRSTDSQELELTVVPNGGSPAGDQRILAFTTRALAGSGHQALTAGFVVGESAADPRAEKRVLVRAVGPTLEEFGFPDALRTPVLKVFNANGDVLQSVTTDPLELAKAQLATGAFPLKENSGDAWQILRLPPGTYAAQVSSNGAAPAFVLLELYDL